MWASMSDFILAMQHDGHRRIAEPLQDAAQQSATDGLYDLETARAICKPELILTAHIKAMANVRTEETKEQQGHGSLPVYAEQQPPKSGLANSSSWNDGGFAFAPNTNALDANTMPSDKAEAARQKSAAVMEALRNGGDADAVMGKQKESGAKGIVPLGWLKSKMKRSDKKDGVSPIA
ncbi:hypothetical protein LTR10_005268 [Elasticomyces elasticus]|nr:hypothetical protein LTR10_005268 [Elasticomyces elasticus]KAK4976005.1 hypothetical protein LTR42_003630 [Elasticomyces elasticus]